MAPPTPPEIDYILKELARRLDEIVGRFERLFGSLDTTYIRRELYDAHARVAEEERRRMEDMIESQGARIAALEDDKKWLVRLVFSFVIMGVLGAAFVVSQAGGK